MFQRSYTKYTRKFVRNLSSWSDTKLNGKLVEALCLSKYKVPNEVQLKSIPKLLEGKGLIINSETGSGKTLTYVLPQLSQLLDSASETPKLKLVVVPNKTLQYQTLKVVNEVLLKLQGNGRGVKRVEVFDQLYKLKVESKLNVLVTTPSQLLTLKNNEQKAVLSKLEEFNLETLTLDECDLLLSRSFGNTTKRLCQLAFQANPKLQLVSVAATLDPKLTKKSLMTFFNKNFDLEIVKLEHTHKLNRNVTYDFIQARDYQHKIGTLLDILQSNFEGGKVLVFCNSQSSCADLHNSIKDKLVDKIQLVLVSNQLQLVDFFHSSNKQLPAGTSQIFITTDKLARGYDQSIQLVIQFETCTDFTQFLHRSGRTGRNNAKGKVISLIYEVNTENRTGNNLDRILQKVLQKPNWWDLDLEVFFSRRRSLNATLKRKGDLLA